MLRNELYKAATELLNDHCPMNEKFQLCRMMEDPDGDCFTCWQNYLWFLHSGLDAYSCSRVHPEGLVG